MAESSRTRTSNRFSGRTIVITGAGGDIGSAAARRFASEGCNVVLVDLEGTRARLEGLRDELSGASSSSTSSSSNCGGDGCCALVAVGDVRRRAEMDAVFAATRRQFGGVDFVFNNAGVQGRFAPTDDYDEETFRQVMDVNVVGVFVVMQAAVAAIKAARAEITTSSAPEQQRWRRSAVIVNTSSLAGVLGPPNMLAYAAAKHAVLGMTRTAAKDLAAIGVRVCAVAPGLLEGAMWDHQVRCQATCRKAAEAAAGRDESSPPLAEVEVDGADVLAQEQRMIAGTALKRLGTLDEVASVVAFLCSDDASYLTGNVVVIDGGRFC